MVPLDRHRPVPPTDAEFLGSSQMRPASSQARRVSEANRLDARLASLTIFEVALFGVALVVMGRFFVMFPRLRFGLVLSKACLPKPEAQAREASPSRL